MDQLTFDDLVPKCFKATAMLVDDSSVNCKLIERLLASSSCKRTSLEVQRRRLRRAEPGRTQIEAIPSSIFPPADRNRRSLAGSAEDVAGRHTTNIVAATRCRDPSECSRFGEKVTAETIEPLPSTIFPPPSSSEASSGGERLDSWIRFRF
nr:hypothetical protein Iba_chr06dCG8560 [Ipomoea batatas]